ncbi:unnamed protein product [Rotaria sordida]|uniref:Uncharacterized protein n=1 Tax=Rotaria sordida TaxID=392033 RepID=A0A815N353_9BILA|nr:unnamed protein product [Rotaria sordida]
MWMLSRSIVELPPKLRSQRCNMLIISIWIVCIEPPAKLWLNYSVNKLKIIKNQSIDVLNVNHKLIILGITDDCLALSEHMNNKRQYCYDTIHFRTTSQYLKFSKKAGRTQSNIDGYLGESVLGHAKLIILSIYQKLKQVQRKELNFYLANQVLPHFFHRKLRSIDNFGFVKANEVRNILFYGLLPHLN